MLLTGEEEKIMRAPVVYIILTAEMRLYFEHSRHVSFYSWGKKTARNTPPFPLGPSPCYSTAPLGVYRYRHFTNLIKLMPCTEKEIYK